MTKESRLRLRIRTEKLLSTVVPMSKYADRKSYLSAQPEYDLALPVANAGENPAANLNDLIWAVV